MQNKRKLKLVKNNKYKKTKGVNIEKEKKKKGRKVLLSIGIVFVIVVSINLNKGKNPEAQSGGVVTQGADETTKQDKYTEGKSGGVATEDDEETTKQDKYTESKDGGVVTQGSEETTKQDKYLELINKYCKIYNLDSTPVYEKATQLTNNFKNIEIDGFFNIPGTKVCNIEQKYDSLELAVLSFIRHCKQKPEDFNLSSEQLKNFKENDITDVQTSSSVTRAIDNSFDNSINYEDKVNEYCALLKKLPKELCMAIIYSECAKDENGEIKALYNNPGNLRENGNFRKFDNVEQGIIELALTLEYNFLKDIDMENTPINIVIEKIQVKYAPDSDTAYGVNKNWSNNVIKIYNELKGDYYSRLDKSESTKKIIF